MGNIRIHGLTRGSDAGTISATIGGATDGDTFPSWQAPDSISGLPRLNDVTMGDTVTVETTGLTNVTNYTFRLAGGMSLQSGAAATFVTGMMQMNKWIEVEVTADPSNTIYRSPPVLVRHMHMMPGDADHMKDENAIAAILPHKDASHIAVTSGDWSSPSTWLGGAVPRVGARVLVQNGVSVRYDVTDDIRLDRLRVDGRLWVDTAGLTTEHIRLAVETLVVPQGGELEIGTDANPFPATARMTVMFSGRDMLANSYLPTDMNSGRMAQTRGWERGLVVLGDLSIVGAETTPWFKAAPVAAGATSITALDKRTLAPITPAGLSVGDTVVIGGTDIEYTVIPNADHAMQHQCEERVVTDISGSTISFLEPLIHDHNNQLPGSTRADIYPEVCAYQTNNIRFESEVTFPNWRRAHFAVMHNAATAPPKVRYADFVNMGRTDKDINEVVGQSGVIDATGAFKRFNWNQTPGNAVGQRLGTGTVPLTPRANLQGRYPVHFHKVGFAPEGARPVVQGCGVYGTPGWGFVHHDCAVDFFNCVALDFFGCGMVSESANEVGAWADNLMMRTTYVSRFVTALGFPANLYTEPKNLEGIPGALGDTFSHGYGYGFRGRAMRTNRNYANSVSYGNVYWHRTTTDPNRTAGVLALKSSHVDLKELTWPAKAANAATGVISMEDYPIVHQADNVVTACLAGLFVSKSVHTQSHDANVKIKNMKVQGYRHFGGTVEYVGTYIIDGFDAIAGKKAKTAGQGAGWFFGANGHQIILNNARVEGGAEAIRMHGSDTTGTHGNYSLDDPRWGIYGLDNVDNGVRLNSYGVPGSKPRDQVLTQDDDWYDTYDYGLTPRETYPDVYGSFFSFNFENSPARFRAADGNKIDNISARAQIAALAGDYPNPQSQGKPSGDLIFPVNAFQCLEYVTHKGFWINSADGLRYIIHPHIISDRKTGRPALVTKLVRYLNAGSTFTNNGTFTMGATPVVQADRTATVATGGSVVIDLLTGATGGGASGAFGMSPIFLSPQNGTVAFDFAAGTVTYTPDPDYAGTDEMYFFVGRNQRYDTVRVDVLVGGSAGTLNAPAAPANFTAADHPNPNTLGVTLGFPPNTGGRKILRTEYSTDGGTTWRRLCQKWIPATHKVTVRSDGTAIANGSYTLRLRVKTDFDYQTSGASSGVAVTVS